MNLEFIGGDRVRDGARVKAVVPSHALPTVPATIFNQAVIAPP